MKNILRKWVLYTDITLHRTIYVHDDIREKSLFTTFCLAVILAALSALYDMYDAPIIGLYIVGGFGAISGLIAIFSLLCYLLYSKIKGSFSYEINFEKAYPELSSAYEIIAALNALEVEGIKEPESVRPIFKVLNTALSERKGYYYTITDLKRDVQILRIVIHFFDTPLLKQRLSGLVEMKRKGISFEGVQEEVVNEFMLPFNSVAQQIVSMQDQSAYNHYCKELGIKPMPAPTSDYCSVFGDDLVEEKVVGEDATLFIESIIKKGGQLQHD